MPRTGTLAATVLAALWATPLVAQFRAPRSADYLFAASAQDARALWVNPAGLSAVYEAAVMGELVWARNALDDFHVAQYTAGFNSRGFGFGFRRDRFANGVGGNAFRLGVSRAFAGLALGGAFTVYSGDPDQRELDLGVRTGLIPSLQLGLAVQHIGTPVVRGVRLPPTGVLGLAWFGARGRIQVTAEAAAADRELESGFDLAYRAGLRLTGGGRRLLVSGFGTIDISEDVEISRLVVGVAVGGTGGIGAVVGDGARRAGSTFVDGVSLTGVARRVFGQ